MLGRYTKNWIITPSMFGNMTMFGKWTDNYTNDTITEELELVQDIFVIIKVSSTYVECI